jgi:hypothetical protein
MEKNEVNQLDTLVKLGWNIIWESPHDGMIHHVRRIDIPADEVYWCAIFDRGKYADLDSCELNEFQIVLPINQNVVPNP